LAAGKVYTRSVRQVCTINTGDIPMQEAALVFLGLLIVAIVNFLGMKELVRAIRDTKPKS
jgi:hypothetical protein